MIYVYDTWCTRRNNNNNKLRTDEVCCVLFFFFFHILSPRLSRALFLHGTGGTGQSACTRRRRPVSTGQVIQLLILIMAIQRLWLFIQAPCCCLISPQTKTLNVSPCIRLSFYNCLSLHNTIFIGILLSTDYC